VFDGFSLDRVEVGEAVLRVWHGGAGPAVVLLHGHPRTAATWHRVAPLLADGFTVVCPDLRGYGRSTAPPTTPDHAPFSKRAMAGDCVTLIRALGHPRFAVVGHDRGSYVALRTALDHPDAVTHLGVLECVPIGEALARCDATFAASWWHWFFLGQTTKPAERVINADPDAWYRIDPGPMGPAAWDDLRAALHDPAVVHAMCEDYRAGLGIDRHHDDADRAAGRRIACPLLVLWGGRWHLERWYDVLGIWRAWADDVSGRPLDCGHYLPEERPEETAAELRTFFA
jgi:haloacetate dehalogenase